MVAPVALRQRGHVTQLLNSILHHARQHIDWQEPDRRNVRLWQSLLLAIMLRRSTCLLHLAQILLHRRKAQTVKSLALGITYFLTKSQCAVAALSPCLLDAVVASLPAEDLVRYRGQALLVLDATDDPKRSRGPGVRQRGMQYIGRVRKNTQSKDTTTGYVDIWAGLVLQGKRFLPLTRRLFSSQHPAVRSQNQVEEAVLDDALGQLEHHHLSAIVVADRGFGRKALLIRLAQRTQAFVIRLDSDILVERLSTQSEHLLADLLAEQAWLGDVMWYRGQAGNLRCRVRKVRAQIHDSRARRADQARASMTFLEVVPLDADVDPLVIATTLPVRSVVDAQGVVRVYGQRWAIESGFETMKSWGLGRFMVRQWQAIDRLLWLVAVAYAVTLLALYRPHLATLRQQATILLRYWCVLGRRLTVGKLAEALAVDFQQHRRAWASIWRL